MSGSTVSNNGKNVKPRVGKDHLSLADWRISVPTYQQPRKKCGDKIDFIEYVIQRGDGSDQRVTLESPARIGLPSAGDEDVVIALLALAKEQEFRSDLVRFVPARLLSTMGWPKNRYGYQRLKASLKRLKAVTITYERTWYSRRIHQVEPVLITGILAEAKLTLRRGRPAKDADPDSYVQWTKNFFDSLKEGNLTNLDLDLYFSWHRPGARHLYRHLNKVWHAGKKPRTYERDLTELACGHLGMKQSKDLKRNFQAIVAELEQRSYLAPMEADTRYRKVRPGVWRVRFELHPDQISTKPRREKGSRRDRTTSPNQNDAAVAIVSHYHHCRFGKDACEPQHHELAHARKLLARHDAAVIETLVPQVAKTVAERFGDDLYFGAAVPYFETALVQNRERTERRQRDLKQQADDDAARRDIAEQKRTRQERRELLLQAWKKLPAAQRARYRQIAEKQASSGAARRRLIRRFNLDHPGTEVLAVMADDSNLSGVEGFSSVDHSSADAP